MGVPLLFAVGYRLFLTVYVAVRAQLVVCHFVISHFVMRLTPYFADC